MKPGQVATFLGRKHKLHDNNTEEVGNNFQTRIQGTRIKHQIGPASVAFDAVARLSETTEEAGRSYRGFNLFSAHDLNLFETVLRGENTIAGFRNADLRRHMPDKSTGQVSRMLKRLWTHNLIRKVGGAYKYYVTEPGRTAITMGLKLKELVLIPELARAMA